MTAKSGASRFRAADQSLLGGFISENNSSTVLLRDLPHAIGVVHAGDVDAFDDRFDLVAEVGEEAQGIALLVGDARDQSRDQDLTRDQRPFSSSIMRSRCGAPI